LTGETLSFLSKTPPDLEILEEVLEQALQKPHL
jgi:hypothetical protein